MLPNRNKSNRHLLAIDTAMQACRGKAFVMIAPSKQPGREMAQCSYRSGVDMRSRSNRDQILII